VGFGLPKKMDKLLSWFPVDATTSVLESRESSYDIKNINTSLEAFRRYS
jgi:hypothetical protein